MAANRKIHIKITPETLDWHISLFESRVGSLSDAERKWVRLQLEKLMKKGFVLPSHEQSMFRAH